LSNRTKLIRVDPHKIKVPEVRVTSVWSDEEYKTFQDSLKADGQVSPIICVKDGEDLWLVDGKHRLDEALLAGAKLVEVAYREGSIVDAMTRNLYINRLRGKTKLSEEVRLIEELSTKFKFDPDKISQKTGLSREAIEQRLAIAKASALVRDAVEDERIGLGTAFQLSRLPSELGQNKLLMALMQQIPAPPTSYVKEIVDQALALIAESDKAPENPEKVLVVRTLRCHVCDQRYEPQDLKGINVCATCFGLARDYIQSRKKSQYQGVSPEQALAQDIASSAPKGEAPP